MKILNIYSQDSEHCPARIVGNRDGLQALKLAIERTLGDAQGMVDPHPDQDPLFASDGEGFELVVEERNDHWGLVPETGKEDPNSFWTKARPFYTAKVRAEIGEKAIHDAVLITHIREEVLEIDKALGELLEVAKNAGGS